MDRVSKGLADAHFEIEEMIAEGDQVAVRLTASARQVGEFKGMPASGRSARFCRLSHENWSLVVYWSRWASR